MAVQTIVYTEEMVGSGHPTKSDTLNRLALVEHNTDGTHIQSLVTAIGSIFLFPGWFNRSKLSWKDANEIYLDAGAYMVKDKFAYWVTQIIEPFVTPGVSNWVYIYLDYSAITSGKALTATEIISNTTAPTFNTTYQQWMNGDDRCIGAVLTDGSQNVLEFFHDGDMVQFADRITLKSGDATYDNTFLDVDCTSVMPGFARIGIVTFTPVYVDGSKAYIWRTNGQSGASGKVVVNSAVGATIETNTIDVITDSGQIFELHGTNSNASTIDVDFNGWKLPIGM